MLSLDEPELIFEQCMSVTQLPLVILLVVHLVVVDLGGLAVVVGKHGWLLRHRPHRWRAAPR